MFSERELRDASSHKISRSTAPLRSVRERWTGAAIGAVLSAALRAELASTSRAHADLLFNLLRLVGADAAVRVSRASCVCAYLTTPRSQTFVERFFVGAESASTTAALGALSAVGRARASALLLAVLQRGEQRRFGALVRDLGRIAERQRDEDVLGAYEVDAARAVDRRR